MGDDQAARALDTFRARLDEAITDQVAALTAAWNAALAAARQDAAAAAEQAHQARLERAAADAEARLRQELEAAAAAADTRLEAAIADARAAGHAEAAALPAVDVRLERLGGGLRRLDTATSLTDILTATLELAGSEAPRVMLVLLGGGEARPWRSTGMPLPGALEGIAAALIADVVARRGPAAGGHVGPESSGAGEEAWAAPLLVDGEPVAVLYAEAGESGWTAALEPLVRHASLCLTLLTMRRAVSAVRFMSRRSTLLGQAG